MYIDEELSYNYQDEGPWRSYYISASGETLEELLEDAYIYEIDQDGGNLGNFALSDAPQKIYNEALKVITATYYKNAFGR